MSELVTGEAVVLQLRLARPATRALALAVDLLVQGALLLILTVPIVSALPELSESMATVLPLAVLVIVFVGYSTTVETLTRGLSLGKYIVGLRVVRDDGGPVRFRQAFVRALAGASIDFVLTVGVVAFTVSMLSERGKRVGDLLAGTMVIRERAPRHSAATPEMPPQLAAWAATLELGQLPDQLALAARSYLGRYYELQPDARTALGAQLATNIARYVSPPPPADTPAWAYLAAVLAERRRRASESAPPTQ